MRDDRDRRSVARIGLSLGAGLVLAPLLAGCGSYGAPAAAPTSPPPTETTTETTALEVAAPRPSPAPERALDHCATGRLAVGDIPDLDEAWRDGLAAAEERARAWRIDASLVSLRVGCEPLEADFRWQGTFYSDSAQSFFRSDSGQTEPAEVDPASVLGLPRDQISFLELHRALARAGYGDDTFLGATGGISVRLNAAGDRFGPEETPEGVVYHVAAVDGRDVLDLFVSGVDWLVRTYGR